MGTKMEESQMEFLDELLDGIKDEPTVTDDTVTTEEPIQDGEINTDEIQQADENKEQDQKDEPVELEQSVEGKEDVEEEKDIQALLREQIVKLTEQLQRDPLQQTVKADAGKDGEGKVSTEDKKELLQAFLTEDEIDRIIDEPQLLNTAFNRAIGVMQQNMQGVIQAEVNRQILVSRAVSDFYSSNQDLAPYGGFVKFVMSEVESKNPTKTYAEIFQLTADESRKRLGLASKTVERKQTVGGTQKPAFAGSKRGTQRPAGKQEFFDPNAADMMNLQ